MQARAATGREGGSMAGTVSGGAPRAHEEASTVAVSRPQATGEDRSEQRGGEDCDQEPRSAAVGRGWSVRGRFRCCGIEGPQEER